MIDWNDWSSIAATKHLLSCTQWAPPEVIDHPQYQQNRKRELHERLAQAVGDRCTTRTEHGASIVYRTEAYVVPPDMFWLLVKTEAERMPKPDASYNERLLRAQAQHLVRALKMIRVVDQGAGGNLSFQQMAESAIAQANQALEQLANVEAPRA